jgi:hypothetical protein
MQQKDPSLLDQVVEGKHIMVSRKKCQDLYSILGDLTFFIHKTKIIIKPQGYLYSFMNQKDCFVGIEAIPDKFNQYRLGSIFLRNFFIGLDYETQQLAVGLNKVSVSASIEGKSSNPYKYIPEKHEAGIIIFLSFLFILVIVALTFFFRERKKERLIQNSKDSQGKYKKIYKNGVEVKPSQIRSFSKASNSTDEETKTGLLN